MTKFKSKVDIAYDFLIESIVNGKHPPGDKIVISHVAQQIEMSEIPIREALRRLESEGYLELNANQSAIVSEINAEKIEQIFQTNGVLEGFASRLSIDYIKPSGIEALRKQNLKMKDAYVKGNLKEYSNLNDEFHLMIYENIPQKELINFIKDLWRKWTIIKTIFNISPARTQSSYEEHDKIIDMLENKQYDDIEFYVREHKFKSGRIFLSLLSGRCDK